MKFFRRFRPDGTPFYIDETGNEVSADVAKRNLQTPRRSTAVTEGNRTPTTPTSDRLVEACRALASSDEEAKLIAKLMREA